MSQYAFYPGQPTPTGSPRAMKKWQASRAEYEERQQQIKRDEARHRTINSATQGWLMSLQREQKMKELERAHEAHRAQTRQADLDKERQAQKDSYFRQYWTSEGDGRLKAAMQYARVCGYENGYGWKSQAVFDALS